ncbi:hypothetical protein NFI96_004094 [Prochilodus magdalenae]|nr:hypothetical protein NFI96_004094 [Prochilodus magdalenae]
MKWSTLAHCVLVLALTWGLHVNAIRVRRSNHVDNICSMWGNFHFKTFDGDIYQFPGTCEYNLVSDCQGTLQTFSVHVKRGHFPGNPQITRVLVTLGDLAIEITKNLVMVNSEIVRLPHYVAGVLLEQNAIYTKLFAKLGLSVMWNREDAIMVELDMKYVNHTCGLCGDFNGIPIYNEFLSEDREIGPVEFGNKNRIHGPNDYCEDPYEGDDFGQTTVDKCQAFRAECSELLANETWSSCTMALSAEPYIQACMVDKCWSRPGDIEDTVPLCTTLSEYSRQCSHAGGTPPNWRKPNFCGTVFDDISERGCIPQEQCQCKHDQIYNPADVLLMDDKQCWVLVAVVPPVDSALCSSVCEQGKWACESLPSPGMCAVEEGSHFTSFDGKEFTFHGDCYYVLSKDCVGSTFTVLGQLMPCVAQETDTCLKSIVLLLNDDKNNALVIKEDGIVRHNGEIALPYTTVHK